MRDERRRDRAVMSWRLEMDEVQGLRKDLGLTNRDRVCIEAYSFYDYCSSRYLSKSDQQKERCQQVTKFLRSAENILNKQIPYIGDGDQTESIMEAYIPLRAAEVCIDSVESGGAPLGYGGDSAPPTFGDFKACKEYLEHNFESFRKTYESFARQVEPYPPDW